MLAPAESTEAAAVTDTTGTSDSLNVKHKGDIETTIKYSARDSIRLDVVTQTAYLYGDAKINYGDITLEAEQIEINWATSTLTAVGVPDSLGKVKGVPLFKEKEDKYSANIIKYNFKTRKGIISDIVTQQGEGYIQGEKVKRTDEALFINSAIYTTCNLAHPHFHISANKLKVIPQDKIVTGPFNLYVADVPTPLGFILGIFPVPKKNKSGLIFPMYGESRDRGFFLRNGGYYFAINDYIGSRLIGEVYTLGSYGLQSQTDYISRYKFRGNLDLAFNHRKSTNPNFGVAEGAKEFYFVDDYKIVWNHQTVSKKNSKLSAGVNFGSTTFNRNNSYNPAAYLTNTMTSSISYSKFFGGTPFNLSLAARSTQNNNTGVYDFTFPDFAFNMNRIYPFKKKIGDGNSWYEKINISYSSVGSIQARNVSGVPRGRNAEGENLDTLKLNFNNLGKIFAPPYAKSGLRHSASLATTIKALKYFNLNPSANFNEYMYFNRLNYRTIGPDTNQTITFDTLRRFSNAYDFNFSTDLTTRVFGSVYFKKGRLMGVRHTLIPTLNYTYRPDFSKLFGGPSYQVVPVGTSAGEVTQSLSRYNGFLYGAPGQGTSNLLSFSLNNTLEAKVKTKNDSVNPTKKVPILENVSMNGSYDFTADSLNLSLINFSARTKLFNRLDINFNYTYDPYVYQLDSIIGTTVYQRRVDELQTVKGFRSRSQLYSLMLSTNLNPTAKKKNYKDPKASQADLDVINANPEMYVDFNIPWSMYVSYNLSYSRVGFNLGNTIQTLSFNGDLRISEKWKIGFNSGYDITNAAVTYTQINVYRDLHCWEMRFNWIPFGYRQSYSFDINVKASVLQDLKLNRKRDWYDNSLRTAPR
ncbi:MAG: LPS-assembly protein LptD [Sporocytophaga sp.]|uniref:putative LPS assembly protein LptD n=1 Tax=Sporocytophaga sp. TaxID=2231183 RepID=UPI001B2574E2|nr:putative LPS assembly protein LptD [Sporocytophaga sp.]MBO9699460.1 LPS-assembly protein LptD [Sporocytophaga sp.]